MWRLTHLYTWCRRCYRHGYRHQRGGSGARFTNHFAEQAQDHAHQHRRRIGRGRYCQGRGALHHGTAHHFRCYGLCRGVCRLYRSQYVYGGPLDTLEPLYRDGFTCRTHRSRRDHLRLPQGSRVCSQGRGMGQGCGGVETTLL